MSICSWMALAMLMMSSVLGAESFSGSVSILEVQVPLQVTVGLEPVKGLTAQDFEVYDRGVRQEIVSFQVMDLSGRSTSETAPGSVPPAVEVSAQDGRNLLLLFDFSNSPSGPLRRAVQAARVMVTEQLHPADRGAVAFSSRSGGVEFIVGFTSDHERLDAALEVLQQMMGGNRDEFGKAVERLARRGDGGGISDLASSIGWRAALALRGSTLPSRSGWTGGGLFFPAAATASAVSQIPQSGLEGGSNGDRFAERPPDVGGLLAANPTQLSQLRNQANEGAAVRRIKDFSETLSDVATLLRDVSGANHLLLFSAGFGGIDAMGTTTTSMLRELGKIRRSFLRSGWVLHTMSLKSSDPFGEGMDGNDSLFFVANETGGRLYENYSKLDEATAHFLERSSVTYLLTFQPTQLVADGHRHKIEVQLVGGPRGARVKHRPAYYAPKPEGRRNSLEHRLDDAARIFGDHEVNLVTATTLALPLRSPAAPNRPVPGPVPVVIEIDGDSLLSGQTSRRLDLEIQGYALDGAGGVADFFVEEVHLDLGERWERLRQRNLHFFGDMRLPPGEYRLRLLVFNQQNGRFSLATVLLEKPVPVEIPAAETSVASGGQPLPPLVLDLEREPLALRESDSGEDHFFNFSGRWLAPALSPRIVAGETRPVLISGYGVESAREMMVHVVEAGGREVPASRVEIEHQLPSYGDAQRFLGFLETRGLKPGLYRLEARGVNGSVAVSEFRVHPSAER